MQLPYLYQLQGADYNSLSQTDFQVAVIDMDDAGLSNAQVSSLQDQGRTLFTYLSIGEAEDYREYWNGGQPDYVINENPNWSGNYRVKFWDDDWQQVVFDRVEKAVESGYNGMYLDIVDAYQVASVRSAYTGSDIREEMISFVKEISAHAKKINPDFKVIPQNAVGLLSEDNPDTPNADYLAAIDGIGVEDLWFDDDRNADWTKWDIEYIETAQKAGKFVLATSYPTEGDKQNTFIDNALEKGFIPYVATRALDGTVIEANQRIPADVIDADTFGTRSTPENTVPAQEEETPVEPTVVEAPVEAPAPEQKTEQPVEKPTEAQPVEAPAETPDEPEETTVTPEVEAPSLVETRLQMNGGEGRDVLRGSSADEAMFGGNGNDKLLGRGGSDLIDGGAGRDVLRGNGGDDIIVYDADDRVIAGGRGFDTLLVSESEFDFGERALRGGIDAVDLSDGRASQMVVSSDDVESNTDDDMLYITGDAGDRVSGDFGESAGTVVRGGIEFERHDSDSASIYVETGLVFEADTLDFF